MYSSKGLLPDIKHWQKFFPFFYHFFPWCLADVTRGQKKKEKQKKQRRFKIWNPGLIGREEYFATYTKFSSGALQNVKDSNGLERH
jgi:hypothetical protein